jgi:hypothetical protein
MRNIFCVKIMGKATLAIPKNLRSIKKAGKKMKTVNWTKIIGSIGRSFVESFAKGKTSGRALYNIALSYGGSAEVRNLLRSRGVDEARQLARKALSRR